MIKFPGNVKVQAEFPDTEKFLGNIFIAPTDDSEFRTREKDFFQELNQKNPSDQTAVRYNPKSQRICIYQRLVSVILGGSKRYAR